MRVDVLASMAEGVCVHVWPADPIPVLALGQWSDRCARYASVVDGSARQAGRKNLMENNAPDRTYRGTLAEVAWSLVRGVPVNDIFSRPDPGYDFLVEAVNVKSCVAPKWWLNVNEKQIVSHRETAAVRRYGLVQLDMENLTGSIVCSVDRGVFEDEAARVVTEAEADRYRRIDGWKQRERQSREEPDLCLVCGARRAADGVVEEVPIVDYEELRREGLEAMRRALRRRGEE
jgi:hypothetical protein